MVTITRIIKLRLVKQIQLYYLQISWEKSAYNTVLLFCLGYLQLFSLNTAWKIKTPINMFSFRSDAWTQIYSLRTLYKHIHFFKQDKNCVYIIKSRGNSNCGTSIKANSQPPVNLLNYSSLKGGKTHTNFPSPSPHLNKRKALFVLKIQTHAKW